MIAQNVSKGRRCLLRWNLQPCIRPRLPLPAKDLRNQFRTAKTKTVVKVNTLPQQQRQQQSASSVSQVRQDEAALSQARTAYPRVIQQHLDNTKKYYDCVVLTRVGDFYELYGDQVERYATLLNLKKARRVTAAGDVAMAGFQYAQLERYLKMLVQDLGLQVAISEQIRLPEIDRIANPGTMLFDRKVTRVVTAGTLIDENFLDAFENNFLLAVHVADELPVPPVVSTNRTLEEKFTRNTKIGLSWVDLSSGDFFTQATDLPAVPSLVARIAPREIVFDSLMGVTDRAHLQRLVNTANLTTHFHDLQSVSTSVADWEVMLERPVPTEKQDEFSPAEVAAGGLVLDYIRHKIMDVKLRLQPPVRRSNDECMAIDKQSLRNLEIRTTLRDGLFQGSLLHALRRTATKSGARLLNQRLVSPSLSLSVINNRLDLVQELLRHDALREDVLALLRRTFDTYRLLQKFAVGRGDADDLLSIARTIEVMQELSGLLEDHIAKDQDHEDRSPSDVTIKTDLICVRDILERLDLDSPVKVAKSIQAAIDEEGLNQQQLREDATEAEAEQMTEEVLAADASGQKVPKLSRRTSKVSRVVDRPTDLKTDEIWIMRRSASPTLERAHSEVDRLIKVKHEMASNLRVQLRAQSLTLKWSPQLGHFCHIKGKDAQGTISALDNARTIGSTKSTRSFYLADWTHLGASIDTAKQRIRKEEERVFGKLRGEVLENIMKLRRNAAVLDELDVACSSAILAKERHLTRPILNEGTSHEILGGRHPTVDVGLKDQGRTFTSNDCCVGEREKIYLITGPNMAGKSTYLRQNALITILAQTGCFVPADHAEIGLVDKIFSRVGSADNLFQDQSTFMVEMLEAADILKQATPRSFVIMDEIGRGTTPEDGVAVGYACLHHLQYTNRCRALFATHFHALADMTRDFESLACYCTDVAEEEDGSWTYQHKLQKGVNRSSHALKVARLAGLPERAIEVAGQVLAELQRQGDDLTTTPSPLDDLLI